MMVLPHLKLALSYILGKDSNNQNGRWFFHGGGEGLKFHIPILKNDFLENILEDSYMEDSIAKEKSGVRNV